MPQIKQAKIEDFQPDSHNANTGTPRGMSALESSVRELGLGRSIVVDKNNVIIAGNKTSETAVDAGFEDALVVETDGSQLVVVKRTDLDIHEARGRRLAYSDNQVGSLNLSWNPEILLSDLQDSELGLDKLFYEDELKVLLGTIEVELPESFPEYDESIANEVEMITCPHCGQTFPK